MRLLLLASLCISGLWFTTTNAAAQANDTCATPINASVGSTPWDNTLATTTT